MNDHQANAPAGPDEKRGESADPSHIQPSSAEVESARTLENEAVSVLEDQGLTRDQIRRLADSYVASGHSGDVGDFAGWVRAQGGTEG